MNETDEDQINWVTVTLDFSPEDEAMLEEKARAQGFSLKCFCIHVLYAHLLEDASAEQKENWQKDFPATLRRNDCVQETLRTSL